MWERTPQAQSLYRKPPYDAATDFAPGDASSPIRPSALVTRHDFPADDLRQFMAYAKADQGKMLFGSAGAGGSNHLACVLLNAAIGINATHVPYRSGAHAMQDLISGRHRLSMPECSRGAAADRRPHGEGARHPQPQTVRPIFRDSLRPMSRA